MMDVALLKFALYGLMGVVVLGAVLILLVLPYVMLMCIFGAVGSAGRKLK